MAKGGVLKRIVAGFDRRGDLQRAGEAIHDCPIPNHLARIPLNAEQ